MCQVSILANTEKSYIQIQLLPLSFRTCDARASQLCYRLLDIKEVSISMEGGNLVTWCIHNYYEGEKIITFDIC